MSYCRACGVAKPDHAARCRKRTLKYDVPGVDKRVQPSWFFVLCYGGMIAGFVLSVTFDNPWLYVWVVTAVVGSFVGHIATLHSHPRA